ncbi:MAG: hypothetical protein OEW83_05805 [Acidimicrobiia bacterium]|nr:hypothetical protein [Acidimicrobiia bacterium]
MKFVVAESGTVPPRSWLQGADLHLTAALDLGDDLEGFVTYDDRLADAAMANGVPVVAPK